MFKMSGNRILIFITTLVVLFFALHNCWQSKSPGEKWLYIYEAVARNYAGNVLGPGRGAKVPVPEPLAGNSVTTHEDFVTFASNSIPGLVLAFAPNGKPPAPMDSGYAGRDWLPMRDSWYVLSTNPQQRNESSKKQ